MGAGRSLPCHPRRSDIIGAMIDARVPARVTLDDEANAAYIYLVGDLALVATPAPYRLTTQAQ